MPVEPRLEDTLSGDHSVADWDAADSGVMTAGFRAPDVLGGEIALPSLKRRRLVSRSEWLLFLTGVNLVLLSFILVRLGAIAFSHMETAALVVTLAYFTGISLGYLVSDRVSAGVLRALLPAFLLIQMAAVSLLQVIYHQTAEWAESFAQARSLPEVTGELVAGAAIFLVIAFGVTSLHSFFLPMVITSKGGGLKRSYSIEILGSMAGLLILALFISLGWTWIIGGYFATFLAVSVLLGTSRYLVGGMVILVAVFLFQSSTWDRSVSTWFYNQKYGSRVQGVAWSEQTPYHKIEVLDLGGGEHMLLLNGRRQFTEGPRHDYSYFVAEYPAKLLESPRVCVLGCSSMSTVGRIGEHARTIRIVDLDAGVFEVSKRFFAQYNRLNELHNWAFTDDDAKHYMAETSETYDLILHDIAPARTRQAALTCTAEFFSLAKARLAPQGVFSMASRTPLDSDSRYGRRLIATLTHVFDRYFILEHGRSVYFYGGGKDMPRWTREHLIQAIEHEGRSFCRLRSGLDLDALVRGDDVITVSNVAGLIYE